MRLTRTLRVTASLIAFTTVIVFGYYFNLTRKSMNQSVSDASLYQIRQSLGIYLEANHCLPAASSTEHSFPHSWRSQLVRTQLGKNLPTGHIDFSQPWDANTNVEAAKVPSNSFHRGTVSTSVSSIPATDFFVVAGTATAYPYDGEIRLSDVDDGLENTVLVLETTGSSVPWTQPTDIELSDLQRFYDGNGIASLDVQFPDGPGLIFADLAVYRMKRRLPLEAFQSLFTISGGERWTRRQLVAEGYLIETHPSPPWLRPEQWSEPIMKYVDGKKVQEPNGLAE